MWLYLQEKAPEVEFLVQKVSTVLFLIDIFKVLENPHTNYTPTNNAWDYLPTVFWDKMFSNLDFWQFDKLNSVISRYFKHTFSNYQWGWIICKCLKANSNPTPLPTTHFFFFFFGESFLHFLCAFFVCLVRFFLYNF